MRTHEHKDTVRILFPTVGNSFVILIYILQILGTTSHLPNPRGLSRPGSLRGITSSVLGRTFIARGATRPIQGGRGVISDISIQLCCGKCLGRGEVKRLDKNKGRIDITATFYWPRGGPIGAGDHAAEHEAMLSPQNVFVTSYK